MTPSARDHERDDCPALELAGVRRRFPGPFGFGGREVLLGIDLVLARGRMLGLAGPNGSGKSTLLEIVAGLDRPTRGIVRVLGGSPDVGAVRRRIGYLAEDSRFPPELGARSALSLLGSLQDLPSRTLRARCDAMLARVGLAGEARTRLGRFSRGMLRRFGLAQAWLHEPELLLLDEPTAGLDAQGFEVLDGLFAEARGRGTTVVMTSHLVSDLERHCDELAILVGGRIVVLGPPSRVLAGRTLLDLYRAGDARGAATREDAARGAASDVDATRRAAPDEDAARSAARDGDAARAAPDGDTARAAARDGDAARAALDGDAARGAARRADEAQDAPPGPR